MGLAPIFLFHVDDVDRERNDRVRGKGVFDKAVRALRLLCDQGLLPILTATEILQAELSERGRAGTTGFETSCSPPVWRSSPPRSARGRF